MTIGYNLIFIRYQYKVIIQYGVILNICSTKCVIRTYLYTHSTVRRISVGRRVRKLSNLEKG